MTGAIFAWAIRVEQPAIPTVRPGMSGTLADP